MRYYISIEEVANHEICCDIGGAKLVWEKQSNKPFFRKKLNGTVTIYDCDTYPYEGYTAIMAMTECQYSEFYIFEDDGVTEVFKGYFFKRDCAINEDLCELSVSIRTIDPYMELDKNASVEYNVLSPATSYKELLQKQNVYIYADQTYFYDICTSADEEIVTASFDGNKWDGFEDLMGSTGYYLGTCEGHNVFYTFHSVTYTWLGTGLHFKIEARWAADAIKVMRIGNSEPEPFIGQSNEWAWQEEQIIAGQKFDVYINGNYPAINLAGYEYNGIISTSVVPEINKDDFILYTRCRRLNECLDYILYEVLQDRWFESDFFSHGLSGVSVKENPISSIDLSNLMIIQNADLKRPGSSDESKVLNISFDTLMGALNTMFNVYYHFDTSNNLHIEHLKYYQNGLSYTNAKTVGIDLTVCDPDAIVATNKYTYENEIPVREKFEYIYATDPDFTGVPIKYCVNEGEEITYSAQVSTQVDSAFIENTLPNEGFTILHTVPNLEVGKEGYFDCYKTRGWLTNDIKSNAHLGFATLQEVYWKNYGRPLGQGIMNGISATFENPRKDKTQVDIEFSATTFDPYELIKTGLGDGEVTKAEYSFKNKSYKVKLNY